MEKMTISETIGQLVQNETINLRFTLNQLTSAINNLNLALIYQDLSNDNAQFYLKKLVEIIEEKEITQYIVKKPKNQKKCYNLKNKQ